MKQPIIILLAFLAILTSCGDSNKVEATEAQTVIEEAAPEATSFSQIAEGSHLTWRATHLGGLEPRFGKVFLKSADVSATEGALNSAKIVFDMATFTVENFEADTASAAKLSGHLQSPDFFNVAENPTSMFEITGVEAIEGEYDSRITGNLTIMGVAKSITFDANVSASDNGLSIASQKFTIDRTDWGLVYNVEGTEGVPADYIISNGIEFQVNVTLN